MDTKSDEQLLIIKTTIEDNKQEADEKDMNTAEKQIKTDEKLIQLTENLQFLTALMMDKTNNYKPSPSQRDTLPPTEPNTVVPTNRRDLPLEGGHYTKIGGMWTFKLEISSSKFYEILIKTELKGDTTMDLKNFYYHINMCLNAVTRLREYLLLDYQSIKRHSNFEE